LHLLRKGTLVALGVALALQAVGCGGGSTASSSSSAPAAATPSTAAVPGGGAGGQGQKLEPVTLRLDWLVNGYDAAFVLAKSKGFYAAEGLDVNILEGKGSAITAETVGNGSDTFGVADAATVALSISKGVPVKYIADYLQQTPLSIVYHQGTTIDSPKDLIGKTVIGSAGDADLTLLPAVLARYGMSEKDLRVQVVQVSAKVPAFLKDKNAVLLGFATGDYLRAWSQEPTAQDKTYAVFGVNPLSIGLITSLSELQNHPDVVRRFLAATTQGWTYTAQHPDEAVSGTLAAFPKADRAQLTKGLQLTLQMLHTPATQGRVVGWMADSDWKATLDLLHQYGGLQKVLPTSDDYTDAFLPAAQG
jgi:NitT/TauT family transport system substrate-binding protein